MEQKANELIEKINIVELHKEMVFADSGSNIIIWEDGTFDTISSNSSPNTDEKYYLIKAWGFGNIEYSEYAEGFYIGDGEGLFLNPETNQLLEPEDMVKECIEHGDWWSFKDEIAHQLCVQMEIEEGHGQY